MGPLGIGLGIMAAQRPLGVAKVLAAYRDDFATGSGALNGRSFKGNSWITALDNTTAGNGAYVTSVPTVDITGKGTAKGGSTAGNKSHSWRVPTGVYDYFIAKFTGGTLPALMAAHQQVDPSAQAATGGSAGTPVAFGGLTVPFGGGAGASVTAYKSDGTSLASGLLGNVEYQRIGDKIEFRTVNISSRDYLELRLNGRMVTTINGTLATYLVNGRYDLTAMIAAGFPALSGKHGFGGAQGTASLDYAEGGDPSAVSRIICTTFGRVAQANGDGSIAFRGFASYTGPDPVAANLRYTVKSAADNSVLAGHDTVAPASVTIDTANKTLAWQTNAFTPSGQFFVEIAETVNVVGPDGQANKRMDDTPYIDTGRVVVSQGQSNMGNGDGTGSLTGGPSILAGQWQFSPNTATPWTALHPAVQGTGGAVAGTANTAIGFYLAYGAAALGNGPCEYISAAVGGTPIASRKPGGVTGIFEAAADSVRKMGGRVDHLRWADGESDVNTAQASYKADVYATLDAWTALNGATIPAIVEAMGSYSSQSDVLNENMRRLQVFTMPAERPGQWVPGVLTIDLQRQVSGSVVSDLHFSSDAYGERSRRAAKALLKLRGQAANDRLGPKMVSARRVDATHIGVTFALNGFDTLALSAGASYTTGKTDVWGGGIRFGTVVSTPASATSATITGGRLYPNGAPAIGTPSGGQVEVIWPFASALPATIYVGGPYGANPYNADKLNAIDLDFAGKASILQGTLSGEPSVGTQPFYHSSGNDYLTAV